MIDYLVLFLGWSRGTNTTNGSMDRRIIDVVFTTALIIASVVILVDNNLVVGGVETDLGSLLLPRLVAMAIIAFSVLIGVPSLLKLLWNESQSILETIDTEGFFGVGLYIVILAAYWYFLPITGFQVTTPVAMFAIAVMLGGRSWWVMAVVSVAVPTIVYYGCSNFLRVFLPVWNLS